MSFASYISAFQSHNLQMNDKMNGPTIIYFSVNLLDQRIVTLIFLSVIVRSILTLILVTSNIYNLIWEDRNKTDHHDRVS